MNKAQAIMYLFPEADPTSDFIVMDDGDGIQYIAEWNMPHPKPTEKDLEAAWTAYQSNPHSRPLTEIEQLRKEQTDLVFELMIRGVL
jgi:hypothetical protein